MSVQPLSRRRFGDYVFGRSQGGTRAGTAAARGVPEPDAVVVRWTEAARRLGVTTRTARDSARKAGIEPVKLPGGQRAIGLREQDLKLLLGGRDRVGGS